MAKGDKERVELEIVATDKTGNVLGDVARKADDLDGKKAEVEVTADDQASTVLDDVDQAAEDLDGETAEVTLTAEGTITMTPWGNENVSTPEGVPNFGWYINGQIPIGALIAKVGKGGTFVKAGTKYAFTAKESGNLILAIGMHQGYTNNQFPGKYNVKVKVEPRK